MIGRELGGYRFVARIGEGGMGTVYRGVQIALGREVAIKVIRFEDARATKRFMREARLASELSHPNVVRIYDFRECEGRLLLVMELLRGRALDRVLDDEAPLLPGRVVRIGVQICSALAAAHGRDIIHRDLKPANVMLDVGDAIKVLDFGLAKSLRPAPAVATPTTQAGAVVGTPAYIAPEAAMSPALVDERSDLYALGCVLYELASGRLPFSGPLAAATGAPAPLTAIPRRLAAVIERLLAKSPDDRFASAADTARALEDALAATGFASTLPGMGAALDDTLVTPEVPATFSQSITYVPSSSQLSVTHVATPQRRVKSALPEPPRAHPRGTPAPAPLADPYRIPTPVIVTIAVLAAIALALIVR